MATLKGNVMGKFSGKLGPLVAKVRDGKPYFSSMPTKYTLNMAPKEVTKRSKFGITGKFASTINKNKLLKKVWNTQNIPANTAFNKMSKVNFRFCGTVSPTVKNIITPDGFDLIVTKTEVFSDNIKIDYTNFDLNELEKKLTFIMYVLFFDPVDDNNYYFELKEISKYDQEGETLKFNFTVTEVLLAEKYRNKIIYIAAVTENEDEKIMRFSKTVGIESAG